MTYLPFLFPLVDSLFSKSLSLPPVKTNTTKRGRTLSPPLTSTTPGSFSVPHTLRPRIPLPSASPTPLSSPVFSPPAPPQSPPSPESSPSPSSPPTTAATSPQSPPPATTSLCSKNSNANDDSKESSSPGGLTKGQKVGAALRTIAAVCLVALAAILYKKRQHNMQKSQYGYAARSKMALLLKWINAHVFSS